MRTGQNRPFKYNEKMIYHVGDLQYDRSQKTLEGRQAAKLAREIWRRYIAGEVTLVQKRLGPSRWEYHAIPKPRPHTPVVWYGGRKYKCSPRLSSS